MHYTNQFTEKVLDNTDIVKVINQYTKLEKQNDVYLGKCVFHNDPSKSMVVYPDKKVFHCFGCGEGGNAAVFLMKYKQISMDQAITILAKSAGIQPTQADIDKTSNEIEKSNLYAINKDAAIFYSQQLQEAEGEQARDYLAKREIQDKTIKKFCLGYSPTKGNALYKYLLNKHYTKDQMIAAGLIKLSENGSPYDMFRGRVMFPIIDAEQRVIAFGGRTMDPEGKPKYLNSPESIIFNKSQTLYGLSDTPRKNYHYMILCEGYMDVISMHQAGFRNAVATLGTAFTKTHIPVVKQYANNMVLAYDSDEAGIKAAIRTINATNDCQMGIRVLSLETANNTGDGKQKAKDPDEFIKTFGMEKFKFQLQRSQQKVDFLIKSIARKYDISNEEEREAFCKDAVAALMKDRTITQDIAIER